MDLVSSVHYKKGFDNAFWNGDQIVYGDGDEDLEEKDRIFSRFTRSIEIIGHELTHGLIQHEAALVFQGQPGALNESISDVFGSMVKQYQLRQDAVAADWLVGSNLFYPHMKARGIRSLAEPGNAYDDPILGRDPQPSHMREYNDQPADNGGVHINSGIPNHAFYLLATRLQGYAWEKAGLIWYHAVCDSLQPLSNFQQMANTTYTQAGVIFGKNSLEQQTVRQAWYDVGLQAEEIIPGKGCSGNIGEIIQRFSRK